MFDELKNIIKDNSEYISITRFSKKFYQVDIWEGTVSIVYDCEKKKSFLPGYSNDYLLDLDSLQIIYNLIEYINENSYDIFEK